MTRTSAAPAFVCALSIVLLAACACGGPQPEAEGDALPLQVVFLANEGFLVYAGGDKVLFDGLFREGIDGYEKLPLESREQVETAQPPFDTVDYVLDTHHHADHFHPLAACRYLAANPLAELVTTNQAIEQIARECEGSGSLVGRVKPGLRDDGTPTPLVLDALDVRAVPLHHGSTSTVENLGFLVHLGGRTVVHLGDSQANADEMRAAGLGEEPIDVAFVPYWYLVIDALTPAITEVLRPRTIVIMHVPPEGSPQLQVYGGREPLVGTILNRYDNVVVFSTPFETATF